MALSLAACGGSDDTTAADDTAADDTADTTPVADPVVDGTPSVGFNTITGTAGADTVNFFVVQNSNGEQTNQFGTGDQINLAGGADVLNAVVQDASSLNAGPSASIAAYLTGVETVNFTALNDSDGGAADGGDAVEINGAFWLGTDVISSVASDASLTVYNVNTLGASDAYGDVGAVTESMTIRMDHTGNVNSIGQESDMMVLFDEDYLIPGLDTATDGEARFYLLDEDGSRQSGDIDVSHVVDADGNAVAAGVEGTRVFIERTGVQFDLGGVTQTLVVAAESRDAVDTHEQYVEALQADATAKGIDVTVSLDTADTELTFLADGTAVNVPAIVVTSDTTSIENPSFITEAAEGVEFNIFGRFGSDTTTATTSQVEINIELEKVGRDGDGGDLIVGGMEDDGIEVFHVEVQGRADQPSSLASLASTNNTLEEVYVEAGAGSAASLEIGNGETAGDINNALQDVRIFDAASFDNGVTLNASIDATAVAKYQNLVDDAANDTLDDVNFQYATGAGDDTINLVIDGGVTASNSSIVVGRHDFDFGVDAGAGDDNITVTMDGTLAAADWYTNQTINDNMAIAGGAGDDVIRTPGTGNNNIDAGAGADAVYTDNTGDDGTAFNDGRATWIFNNQDADINDITGAVAVTAVTGIVNLDLVVTYAGYAVTVEIAGDTGTSITDLTINQAIKEAINNDEHLSHVLVAEDHAGRSLVVRSLQDDLDVVGDLAVNLVTDAASAAQTSAGFAALTNTQANGLGFANASGGAHAASANSRWDSEFARDNSIDAASNSVAETATGATGSTAEVQTITLDASFMDGDTFLEDTEVTIAVADGTINTSISVEVAAGSTVAAAATALESISFTGWTISSATLTGTDTILVTQSTAATVTTVATSTLNGVQIDGANSVASSDNIITGAAGDDTIVLGSYTTGASSGDNIAIATAKAADASSNDTVVYDAVFGNDAIVHFAVDIDATTLEVSAGTDFIDFTAFVDGYTADPTSTTGDFGNVDVNDSIVIADIATGNDTDAEILALYTDGDAANTDDNHIYIRIEDPAGADTLATVFHITDGEAADDATITELGTIQLIDASASWGDLTADNFTIA